MNHPMVSLGSVAEFINGVAFKPSDWEPEGKKIVRIQNLTDPEKPFNRTKRAVDSKYVIHRGDLLVSWSATLGVFTWDHEETALVNQHIFRVDPDTRAVDRGYLRHMLTDALLDMERHLHGATMKHVNRAEFLATLIPLPHKNGKPDLDEQKRIAAILDKSDAIRRKRQQALRLTDDFLRSVFLDMFGDPVTNPKGWDTTTVGKEVEFLTSGSRGWAQYYADEGDFFIRIQNLRGGMLDLSDSAFVNAPDSAEARRTRVKPGDVLLSITADLGRTAVVPVGFGKGHINQHLAILRLKTMNPVFVAQLLASPGGQRQFVALNRSAVKAGLNFDDVRSISLLRPPSALQDRFANIVAGLEKRQTSLSESSTESADLFASLQQRAFRGEL